MFEGLLQPMHLLIILAIALVLFGPKHLPELGKSVGQTIRSVREGLEDVTDDEKPAEASAKTEDQNS